ncbi:MAG: two-component system sensor histidine kinase NtrB [Candidatus Sumerlaeaceae bacterium]
MQKTGGFEDKFVSKLSKIDRQEIEAFLGNLVREKNFLQVVFNAMLDGILVLRPSLEILYANEAALTMLSISPKRRIVGERISSLVGLQEFSELIARFALHRERILGAEIEVGESALRVLSVSIIPLEGGGAHQSGSAVVILHDLTESHLAAEEKRKADRALTLANLTAGLAHEIKNPLNSLQIHAQLLQKALNDPRARKADKSRMLQSSEIIVEEIKRLSRVVDDFLRAVRPTRPMVSKTDFNRLVERTVATMQPDAEARGVRFQLRLDHDIPLVEVDPNQMTQALINLLKNALEALTADATTEGAAGTACIRPQERTDCRVDVRTEIRGSDYLLRVADNGPGIPEEDLRRIFEPYFTTKFSGTGLGLAIVSRIVEEHHGHMNIVSQPGQGTVVTLSFPLEQKPVRYLPKESSDEPANVMVSHKF